jgi:hypothetical protein
MSQLPQERRFEADVYYEAWRRGADPDGAVAFAEQREHFGMLQADESAESFVLLSREGGES